MRSIQWKPFITVSLLCILPCMTGCGGGGGSVSVSPGSNPTAGAAGTTQVAAAFTPNYVNENDPVTKKPNKMFHWPALPVTIYFIDNGNLTPSRKSKALEGFNWWVTATKGVVNYQVVTDPKAAEIMVQFVPLGQTGNGGDTAYKADANKNLISATITFNLTYFPDPTLLPPLAAHELGHALGIGGHSNNTSDVMAESSLIYNLTQVSTRDLNTLESCYPALFGQAARSLNTNPLGPVTALNIQ